MKKSLSYLFVVILAMLFIGCGAKNVQEPQEPIGKNFKFEKISLNFMQKHFPKNSVYQSKEDVEKRLNDEILKNLKYNDLVDNNSIEELIVNIDFRRIFIGEDLPFESMRSDTIATPKFAYEIKILKNGKVLRNLIRNNLIYDPGFVGNLKTIGMMNADDSHENNAIEALSKDIVEQIKSLK